MTSFEHQVRERAYFIWAGEGHAEGSAVDNWLRAEAELLGPAILEAAAIALCSAPSPAKALAKTLKAKPERAKAAVAKVASAAAKPAVAKTATAKAASAKAASAKAAAAKPAAAKAKPRATRAMAAASVAIH